MVGASRSPGNRNWSDFRPAVLHMGGEPTPAFERPRPALHSTDRARSERPSERIWSFRVPPGMALNRPRAA